MKDTITRELLIACAIIFLLVVITGPSLFVRDEFLLALIAGVVIMLGVFGILIRKDSEEVTNPRDRRTGDRAAFFTAVGILGAGILIELVMESPVDNWLWVAFFGALAAKSIGFWRKR